MRPDANEENPLFQPADILEALSTPAALSPDSAPHATPAVNPIEDLDSGRAFQALIDQYTARIRQLKAEIAGYKKENDQVVEVNLLQNLELITMNQSLEKKVADRTRELELSYARLALANERLQQQTRQLQELAEAKDALTHMIVHDMKNPLTAILGTLRLFKRNTFNLEPQYHELLLSANAHGIKLLGMIEEMLIVSRMQSKEFQLKPEPTDLAALVRQSVDLMRQTTQGVKPLQFRLEADAAPCVLPLDSQLIERVVNNLLNNSIKYAPPESEILIRIQNVPGETAVSVTNWGEPIPEKFQRKIFEMFCRVKSDDTQLSGTGLGLTFCKLAVEAHGGRIGVVSPVPPEKRGACFQFFLKSQIQ